VKLVMASHYLYLIKLNIALRLYEGGDRTLFL
jgi:hypothetical protein